MSDLDAADRAVARWLQPLADDAEPCGPDLEYDNDFLALSQAAAGKPESQFGPAEPPEWRSAFEQAEALLDRSRDLRIAITWVRAGLHMQGLAFLPSGFRLLHGLIESHWDHLHPLPDPDDGDPYARVNALTLLREPEGLIDDLRSATVVADRAIGELRVRTIEVACGLSPARSGDAEMGKAQVEQMLQAAVARVPGLPDVARQAADQVRQLMTLINERLTSDVAPDLRPLYGLCQAIVSLMPAEAAQGDVDGDAEGDGSDSGADGGAAGKAGGGRLAGAVNSRADAIRAIDMVCEYLERAEPTNPAPLYLRRGRQLISHNFLQLMKVLAPDALSEVARVVGIDPDSIESPDGS
ncbi:MAG: type VI secretion system protein TssA [Rubrivivax sp.]|nr:type VI secretion system protein TssA [Rubrivivax sp.]